MASYKELLEQRQALESQIANARKEEIDGAVTQVKTLVAEFGLTAEDLFPTKGARVKNPTAGRKVAAKYKDPATGATWTGRGKAPLWIAGKDRSAFTIA